MNSPPNYEWEQLLDIDDFDLQLTPVLRTCNNHVRETTTTTTQTLVSSQNPDVDSLEEKPVRIILGPAGIIQAASSVIKRIFNKVGMSLYCRHMHILGKLLRMWARMRILRVGHGTRASTKLPMLMMSSMAFDFKSALYHESSL
ncbi:hypothetical protein Tco_1304846 [Tanacetum coccineum]